jgi:hypothetical protein
MSDRSCTGEPISWLRLERYRLGELSDPERDVVAAHLDACPACAACLAEANRPIAMAPLLLPGTASLFSRVRCELLGQTPVGTTLRIAFALAALGLLMLPGGKSNQVAHHASRGERGIKGGEVTVALARERNGIVEHGATTFAPDDKWKVLVTCPMQQVLFWDLAVVEGDRVTFPLLPAAPIACGNHAPLPGAFRLVADHPVEVCLVWGDDPLDRVALSATDAKGLTESGICATLQPAQQAPANPRAPSSPEW